MNEGDLLFTLDQRPYQAAANAARGRAQQARATRDQANADLNRAQQLREADAISEEELEQARTAAATAQAAYAAVQADAQSAALELEYTEIRSPISGRLSQRLSLLNTFSNAALKQAKGRGDPSSPLPP